MKKGRKTMKMGSNSDNFVLLSKDMQFIQVCIELLCLCNGMYHSISPSFSQLVKPYISPLQANKSLFDQYFGVNYDSGYDLTLHQILVSLTMSDLSVMLHLNTERQSVTCEGVNLAILFGGITSVETIFLRLSANLALVVSLLESQVHIDWSST